MAAVLNFFVRACKLSRDTIGGEFKLAASGVRDLLLCCKRRAKDVASGRYKFRGLRLLDEDRARYRQALQKKLAAAEQDPEALQITVGNMAGQQWKVRIRPETTGAELKMVVAELSCTPRVEVSLICGMAMLQDEERLLESKAAAVLRGGQAPQVQMVRSKRQLCLSGSADRTLRMWDASRCGGEPLACLEGHLERVTCVAVDWMTMRAISGSTDGFLKLWDLETMQCVETLGERRSSVRCLSVDWKTGSAISSDVTQLRLWNLNTGQCVATFNDQYDIQCVAMDWETRRGLSGSSDGGLLYWDINRGAATPAHQHMSWIACALVCSEPGAPKRAVSGSIDGCLKLWDMDTVQCLGTTQGRWGDVRCVAVHWSSARAITGTELGDLLYWDFRTGTCLGAFRGGSNGLLHCIACVSVDWVSLKAATGASNGEVKLWDLRGKEDVQVVGSGYRGEVRCITLQAGDPPPPGEESSEGEGESEDEQVEARPLAAEEARAPPRPPAGMAPRPPPPVPVPAAPAAAQGVPLAAPERGTLPEAQQRREAQAAAIAEASSTAATAAPSAPGSGEAGDASRERPRRRECRDCCGSLECLPSISECFSGIGSLFSSRRRSTNSS
eukprot:TRINITY_DN90752_c0_g1_i1.p1 TRINITY_DN90752_c0_g1~~TRINITY_DN90752_c0_g1_i1.p1  ORF type:complete len:614 (-),score=140.60 TRINITY_DN90752_c0_g1_i1:68-1909(-)